MYPEDQGFQMAGTTVIDPYGHIVVKTQTEERRGLVTFCEESRHRTLA